MDPKQNLYYALGQIAYALACADGAIQKEEKEELHRLVTAGAKENNLDLDYSDIIFHLLQKEHTPLETAYEWGMHEMRMNSQYLSEKMKRDFISILESVACAFPPITVDEEKLIDRFIKDISDIHGDPVFTGERPPSERR